jgi:ribose transport system substrate-binding protein
MNKFLKIIILVVSMFFSLGCSKSSIEDKKTIGFVISTLNNPFFVSMKKGVLDTANIAGYEVIILDSNNNSVKERSNIEDLITKKVKVIIVNPEDSLAVSAAVKYANKKNVSIITLDRVARFGKITSHIESDNIKGGGMAANYINKKLKKGDNIIELEGIPGTSVTKERGIGFDNKMRDNHSSGINIVAKQTANFDRTQGLNVTQNMLQVHPNIKAIFAQNDEMALGAARALQEKKKHDVIIVGFDGTEEALEAIRVGKIHATVAQQPYVMGKISAETAIKVLNHEIVDNHINAPLKLITKDL